MQCLNLTTSPRESQGDESLSGSTWLKELDPRTILQTSEKRRDASSQSAAHHSKRFTSNKGFVQQGTTSRDLRVKREYWKTASFLSGLMSTKNDAMSCTDRRGATRIRRACADSPNLAKKKRRESKCRAGLYQKIFPGGRGANRGGMDYKSPRETLLAPTGGSQFSMSEKEKPSGGHLFALGGKNPVPGRGMRARIAGSKIESMPC